MEERIVKIVMLADGYLVYFPNGDRFFQTQKEVIRFVDEKLKTLKNQKLVEET